MGKNTKNKSLLLIKNHYYNIMTEKEIEVIYKKHQKELISWTVFKYAISQDDAKDIFQESILALVQNIIAGKMKNDQAQIKSYLYGIAKNKINDKFRKGKNTIPLDETFANKLKNDDDGENTLYSDKNIELIQKSIAELGKPCSEVLTMYYFWKYSMKKIAEQLKYSSEDSAKTSKNKCYNRLKAIFETHYNPNN